MDIVLGGKKVIEAVSLHILNNEDAWLEFDADKWRVKIRLTFVERKDTEFSGVNILAQADHSEFQFYNWVNPMGMTIDTPMKFWELEGRSMGAYLSGVSTSSAMKTVHITFFWM